MFKNIQVGILILLAGILMLGFYLRHYNIYTWPRTGATFDEYAWTWQGINLIQKGVPISWSPHVAYETYKSLYYQDVHFRIVTPFLEHPPVFGLVAGGFALLNGVDGMFDVTIQKIRPLALILGVSSIFFLYLFVKEVYGTKSALLASLLYATIPSVVVGSRILQNDNFFVCIWLLSLYLCIKSLKVKWLFYFVFGFAVLMVLAKVPYMAAGLSFVGIYLYSKQYKRAILTFSAICLGITLYILYGLFYDWELFLNLMRIQTARYDLTYNSIFALFEKPFLVDRYYTDGWILAGWFSVVILSIQNFKKHAFILIPLLAYLGIFLAGIPDEPGHGWYRYPFYPFLIISLAIVIKDYFARNYVITFLLLVFIGTSLYQNVLMQKIGFSFFLFRISILLWGITLLPLFIQNIKLIWVTRGISYGFLLMYLMLNFYAARLYNEQ